MTSEPICSRAGRVDSTPRNKPAGPHGMLIAPCVRRAARSTARRRKTQATHPAPSVCRHGAGARTRPPCPNREKEPAKRITSPAPGAGAPIAERSRSSGSRSGAHRRLPEQDALNILPEQINRDDQQNEILQQKRSVHCHRGKPTGARIPALRHERQNGQGGNEGGDGSKGAQHPQLLAPESEEQERSESPFGGTEKHGGA